MRKIISALGLALLLPTLAPLPVLAQDGMGGMGGGMGGMGSGGMGGGGMGGGGMGRGGGRRGGEEGEAGPARGANRPPEMKPINRDRLDKMVTAMFQLADSDRDGIVTLDELRAVLAARRDAAIRTRFERIDTNHNKLIDPQEFIAWQTSLGSAAISEEQAMGNDGGPIAESLSPPASDNHEDRIVLRLIEPLSATVITSANVNYDKGASLPELIAYEHQKFDALDTNKDGFLVGEELRAAEPRGEGGRGRRGGPGMPPPGGGRPADGGQD